MVEREGGAWCPRGRISADHVEWLQVDLQGLHKVTAVATQGRFDQGAVCALFLWSTVLSLSHLSLSISLSLETYQHFNDLKSSETNLNIEIKFV